MKSLIFYSDKGFILLEREVNSHQKLLNRLLWSILTFFYLFYGQSLIAQDQTTFRQLSVKDGLSQNSAVAVAQDSTGNLWIATQDGLNKYDGRQFTNYPFKFIDVTRPAYSTLGQIYVDRQSQLWVIPDDGIPYQYNSQSDQFIPLKGIADAYAIFQDSNFNYWITTFSNKLFFMNGATHEIIAVPFSRPLEHRINKIVQTSEQSLLLLGNNLLVEVDIFSKKSTFSSPQTSIAQPTVNYSTIIVDSDGNHWFGTYGNGLYRYNSVFDRLERIQKKNFQIEIPSNLNILDLHLDSKNRLWIATYGEGLYMYDIVKQSIRHYKAEKHNPRSLHYNDILCVYEDYLGTLWFGTDGAGLSYFDENLEKFNSFTNNQTPDNINIDVVRAIAQNKKGQIWIGTSGKGLTQYNPINDSWKTFAVENSDLISDRIISLLPVESELWIGTQDKGLSILDETNSFTNYNENTRPILSAKTIWNIFKDSNDNHWLATRDNGLILFDKNKGEIKKYQPKASENDASENPSFRVIVEDSQNHLWIGTDAHGLFRVNPKNGSFKNFTADLGKNTIANNAIKSLYYAPNNILWIGTDGYGLNAFNLTTQKFYTYTTKQGLANNVIYGILPDEQGNLWLSSNKGISRFIPGASLDRLPKITNYNNYDGLATEFNTGAYCKDDQGNLYFGGLDGFYWFQPKNIGTMELLPKTTISGFQVLDEPHSLDASLRLPHNKNTLAFTFSSMQFSLPHKNNYKYRLLNYDKNWINTGNKNYARYTHLPPGDYVFEVKSSNYDGVWNQKSVKYSFGIDPPWYFTIYAKLVYGLVFFLMLFGIYGYLKWRWKMQLNLQINEQEAERLKKLNDFRTQLYSNIAHEFKTPLTLISGLMESLSISKNKSVTKVENKIELITWNISRLTQLVNQLLHLSRLEEGKHQKIGIYGDLSGFLKTLIASFEFQAKEKNIHLQKHIDVLPWCWYDEDMVEKVVGNLLSNTIKYSPENSMAFFDATLEKEFLKLTVQNTMEFPINQDRIFQRFYQADPQKEGMGIGLALVKELVTYFQGTIEVTSDDKQITFTTRFKVTKEAFTEDEIQQTAIAERLASKLEDQKLLENVPLLLIVEDDADTRAFLASSLKEDFKIVTAKNGQEGFEKTILHVPDIIISDIRMPILNGIDFCKKVKNDQRSSHIPLILLTSSVDVRKELEALELGADDYLLKPFKVKILNQRLQNLLKNREEFGKRYARDLQLRPNHNLSSIEAQFLNEVQSILNLHLTDPNFNTSKMCKLLSVSRMQLHRKLQTYTGLSTSAFIKSQRLKLATDLLHQGNLTINEVAYATGFNTPSYFMKSFKAQFQITPTQFSEQKKP